MAPVRISHVVSFSSQDPKYPVENLLDPDSQRGPWLSCPRDKSGQLKVELQLEKAVTIGYIDVGNCGCAFLQIDVGRSSWPLDRPFVTLLPATMLMSLMDSKQGKNRSGVRMFKNGDFLTPASSDTWDRLRLTCSQPFTRYQSFGLTFLRVCSSLDSSDDAVLDSSTPGSSGVSQVQKSDPSPWMTNPSIRRTFFPDPPKTTKEISNLKNMLKQLQPGTLGRSAQMVLSAACKASPASVPSPTNNHREPGSSQTVQSPDLRTKTVSDVRRKKRQKTQGVEACGLVSNSSSQPSRKRKAEAEERGHSLPQTQVSPIQKSGQCPICAGIFSMAVLPQHAATCGEPSPPHPSSPSSSPPSVLWVPSPESPPLSWTQCPICQLLFSTGEIEEHASMCGEA